MSIDSHRRALAITGLGAISALGKGCGALWGGIEAGTDGIREILRFSTEEFTVGLGALVPPEIVLSPPEDRCTAYALMAAQEAWHSAGLADAELDPQRIGLVLGTTLGHRRVGIHAAARMVASHFGIAGPCVTVSTACSSSTGALGLAADLIEMGAADLVLAGGAEELAPEMFAGFHALGVMCPGPCAPFSEPVGLTLGEGGGFMVVETVASAKQRNVESIAYFGGYGLSADAYHATSPDPSGAGMVRAMRSALRDAGLASADIGYVNVHGTGTDANDPAEWRALERVFGENVPPYSATKSIIGHAQGAAGILEAIATMEGLRRQRIPPTLHYCGPRRGCPVDPVAQSTPRQHRFQHAVSTSAAFGGANAAVVFSSVDQHSDPGRRPWRPVRVLGAGVVGPHGLTLKALEEAWARVDSLSGQVPIFRLDRIARGVDPRGMDPSTCYLIAAASAALSDAGLRLGGRLRERAGLMVGATQLSPTSVREFLGSIRRRGLIGASATAFSRMVLNAPAGACAMALSMRGPTNTLTTGAGSGLMAIIHAAHWLATRGDTDLIVAGGVDELSHPGDRDLAEVRDAILPLVPTSAEGAASLVLAADDVAAESAQRPIFLVGWGLAGTGDLTAAVSRALAMAGLSARDLDGVYGQLSQTEAQRALGVSAELYLHMDPIRERGGSPATSAVLSAVAAILELRRRPDKATFLVTNHEGSTSAAIVLQPGECV